MAEGDVEIGCKTSDEIIDFRNITQKTWEKMKISRFKDGFAEGKFISEEKALQSGFNEGYQAGFQTSYKVAVLKGIIGAVATNLKETNPEQLVHVEKLKKEISELEVNCLEIKRNVILAKDLHSMDTLSFDSSEIKENEPSKSTQSTIKDNQAHLMESLKIEKQFNILKKNVIQFLEDSGYTSLTKHIVNI